jgi:predicted RNA-binding Zn-ribbon protein involved in translation (DUF1610 family)
VDKFAVETDEEETPKTAEEKATCPRCGSALRPREATGVPLCPNCGSQPFERKDRP